MWAYGEIGYHTGLMSRYSEFKSRYAYKRANFFLMCFLRYVKKYILQLLLINYGGSTGNNRNTINFLWLKALIIFN